MEARTNIVLIGMPGAGKSTLGVLLAKALGYDFLDTDVLIQRRASLTLTEYLQRHGHQALRQLESQTIADLDVHQTVIATGGSAIYGESAMRHLSAFGNLVYLRCPLSVLDQRIGDMNERGIAAPPGQGLHEVEAERVPLYERYAHATLDVGDQSMEDALGQLQTLMTSRWPRVLTRD